jgi:hypothetical protein
MFLYISFSIKIKFLFTLYRTLAIASDCKRKVAIAPQYKYKNKKYINTKIVVKKKKNRGISKDIGTK